MNLVDQHGSAQPPDEAVWIPAGGVPGGLIVECDDSRWMVVGGDLLGKSALANLPGTQHENHSTVVEGLNDKGAGVTLDQHEGPYKCGE